MQRVERLPSAFQRFAAIGGVLDFAVFEGASGSRDEVVAAVVATLRPSASIDPVALRATACRRIGQRVFFGDWFDRDTGAVIRVGDWRTDMGEDLHDPRLADLDHRTIVSGGGEIPEAGTGGQFAYAFTQPPYPLQARASEVQALFDQVRLFIVPPRLEAEILDWSSDRLPAVSDYFADGMEWWGVFLFSVYVPELQRLTIIAGSSTD